MSLVLIGIATWYAYQELENNEYQARYFYDLARKMSYQMENGPSPSMVKAPEGPYDKRLGYSYIPQITNELLGSGMVIVRQSRPSRDMLDWQDHGYPIYREKVQAGLRIYDKDAKEIYSQLYPTRIYQDFNDMPDLVWKILLLIENRDLLDPAKPFKNPALDWTRLGKAIVEKAVSIVLPGRGVPGGSTLATQMEKYRHSEGGFTSNFIEKLLQMRSASLRAYQSAPQTMAARKQIVLDYINSVPLASRAGYGEVQGLGDGLWVWYGSDFRTVSKILRSPETPGDAQSLAQKAIALKQVLSIFLAHKRPSYFFLKSPAALEERCQSFLGLMQNLGMISPELRAAAAQVPLKLRTDKLVTKQDELPLGLKKATNSIRTKLLSIIKAQNLYDLDRLDMTVRTTFATDLQIALTDTLQKLADPAWVQSHNLRQHYLIDTSDPAGITYSFTLYEKTDFGNMLRIQTDNFAQALNINEGSKLDLGSTAKLRTLVHYLQLVEQCHQAWQGKSPAYLSRLANEYQDPLSQWALQTLKSKPDISLEDFLQAALLRPFSADPSERFYTGGGIHIFGNFGHFGGQMNLYDAIRNSVNLPLVRLMREEVQYHMSRLEGNKFKILTNPRHPQRKEYLEKFADIEGNQFMKRFYNKYRGKNPEEIRERLISNIRPTAARIAAGICYLQPNISQNELNRVLSTALPDLNLSPSDAGALYARCGQNYSLEDRGFLTKVHPLELVVAKQLFNNPSQNFEDLSEATRKERLQVYSWLYKSDVSTQNLRIQNMLESEAFDQIHTAWQKLGYPFSSMVPSLASALGASGDRPAALADLMGILVNNGLYRHSYRMTDILMGQGTPYEIQFGLQSDPGERVLSPEVCLAARRVLLGVVEHGTAGRVNRAFDFDGVHIPIGGKTGTGDMRFETFDKKGDVLTSHVVGRTATFVFYIGDKYYGTLTAFVRGPKAANYSFTSMLTAQILKLMSPVIRSQLFALDGELLHANYDHLRIPNLPMINTKVSTDSVSNLEESEVNSNQPLVLPSTLDNKVDSTPIPAP